MTEKIEQLQEAMTSADVAYVEKTCMQPAHQSGCELKLRQTGEWVAQIWVDEATRVGIDNLIGHFLTGKGSTPDAAISSLLMAISEIPSKDERDLREFQHDLGKLIDKGREFGIDVDFVNPLVETSKRLAENVLTDQRAAQ